MRLPPVGTLRWWAHVAVEKLAPVVFRPRVLPLLRRAPLLELAERGHAESRADANDPPEQVSVVSPAIVHDPKPARFDAVLAGLVGGYATVECRTWTLDHARFVFPAGLVAAAGAVPAETLGQRIWPHSYQYLPLVRLARSPGKQLAPGCIFAFPHWNNLYHWLTVMFPLALTLREQTDLPLYVPANGPRFVTESLGLVGLGDRMVLLPDGVYSCERAVLATIPGHGLDRPSPRHVERARRALLERTPPSDAGRRLYISRADAPDRRVLNEPELVAALGELGFERVTPGELPLVDQLRLFASAEVVVGAHGAGLANAVVAPAGAWLIELVGDKSAAPMYAALASFAGLRYGYLRAADSYRDHVVPVDAVVAAVRRAINGVTPPSAAEAPA